MDRLRHFPVYDATAWKSNLPRQSGSIFTLLLLYCLSLPILGGDLAAVRQQIRSGRYGEAANAAKLAIEQGEWDEEWPLLHIEALLHQGEHEEARRALETGLARHRGSVRVRLLGFELLRRLGEREEAQRLLRDIEHYAENYPWRYADAENWVALGEAALLAGGDARAVLEKFFDRALAEQPRCRDAYLAIARLSLDKHDDAIAAETCRKGLKHFPDDPDLLFHLARALQSAEGNQSEILLAQVLKANPHHLPALMAKAHHAVDAEQGDDAETLLARILAVNPRHAEAWSLRAVLAHLRGDTKHEAAFRATARACWPNDPRPEYWIGAKLARKYRFREGAEHQRRALDLDPQFLPAKMQLAQDLLRLGEEDEGWRWAEEAFQQDSYDVVAFNLTTLREGLNKFRTLKRDLFIVRMEAREAEVYGTRVLDLLCHAKDVLSNKYAVQLEAPITVEIFPQQSDFAVRTFGMPGGAGYLGVCFGTVITANSPASQRENPSSWEAVLWHEFCHAVTLQMTRNKMPRWLSEGISVYEEKQRDPTWGQDMNRRYRAMILNGELTPIGKLSGAFLAPPSGMHLQFAYYQSSLVVEYLVATYKLDCLKSVLRDLGAGMPINEALARHTGVPLAKLEQDFAAFAKSRAEQYIPNAEWQPAAVPPDIEQDLQRLTVWVKEHPRHIAGLESYTRKLLAERQWDLAETAARKLLELYPEHTGPDNAYETLAAIYRHRDDHKRERDVLTEFARRRADGVPALLRLLQLTTGAKDWRAARHHAERLLAVDPLLPDGHYNLGRACEALGDNSTAIASYTRLLALTPPETAETHFRLARLLQYVDRPCARRHVLLALEEAPRYRDAHRLLLELTDLALSTETNTNK